MFVGAVIKTEAVWSTADVFMGLMAIVNLVAIIGLSNIAFAVMNDYQRQRKAGKNQFSNQKNWKSIYLVLKVGA